MNPLIRRLVEHEAEGGKLRPEVMVYLKPEQIGENPPGCRCGKCLFFQNGDCMLTKPAPCNAEHGVCALFLGNTVGLEISGPPMELIPKESAGYIEDNANVPTRCANCEYYSGGDEGTGSCEKVGGTIYANGCCNGWEPKPGAGEDQDSSEGDSGEEAESPEPEAD